MLRFIFFLLPWWLYAAIAVSLAPITVEMFEDYQADQIRMEQALAAGPVETVPVRKFGPAFADESFGEVRLNGTLRADLGVQLIVFGETTYSFVVLDDTDTGPVVALLFPNDEAGTLLPLLVDGVDTSGRVTVQGFLRPDRAGEISRQLAVGNGISRAAYAVEPFFGPRANALSDKVSDTLTSFAIMAGITAFLALTAVWRFSRWRKRRAAKQQSRSKSAPRPATTQPSQVSDTTPPEASPWGSFTPQPKTAAAPGNAMVKPQSPQQASASAAKAKPAKPAAKSSKDKSQPAQPDFKSVFPGGASAFRFKSADDIIRQSFGSLSTQRAARRAR